MKLGKRQFGAATCKVGSSIQIPKHMRDGIREISAVYVPPEQRRQGFATKLIEQLCQEADEAGLVLLLHVQGFSDEQIGNGNLRDWYTRFGFAPIQAEPLLMARMVGATPRFLATHIATATQ
jgi:GNAT superfamily N-acetyltransferase